MLMIFAMLCYATEAEEKETPETSGLQFDN